MIKPFVGSILDHQSKEWRRVKKADGFLWGQCDHCHGTLPDGAGGWILVSRDLADFSDAAFADCWSMIGRHLICPDCVAKIERGSLRIRLVKTKTETKETKK